MSTVAINFVRTPQPDHSEIAAKIVSLLSFSIVSGLFGMKTYNVQYRYLTYSRWLVLLLYVFSWAFTVISMVLVTTNNANFVSCLLSILVCDVFYSGTKLVIYAWLIEKVYIVSSTRKSRWNTLSYKIHVLLMMPYIAILTLMLVFHTAELESDGICIIGLQSIAAIPLIAYDFLINLYMTFFFIRPLLKLGKNQVGRDRKQSRLNEVALRTLVASVVCLIVSFANIFALQLLKGRERGLVCLTCCTVDVTINVITIHWVTSQSTRKKTVNDLDYITSLQNRVSNPDDILQVANVIKENELYGYFPQKNETSPQSILPQDLVDSKIEIKCDDHTSTSDISSLHDSRKSLTKR
ncbi:MAG: hypothetical protein EXX96DRAFT_583159 [Benjaminiella poitrasii]|nr:MAG: hypothetical protein EXX96DRAFT_583159 [Benjaminiella poitrasii]